jgi:sulfite reductase alpha subunit-like flavoprotein/predicted heme/steroid binding protein
MFHYFGYGSNLTSSGLCALGDVPMRRSPLRAERAVLEGWALCFDGPDPFGLPGHTPSLRTSAASVVHGVVFACRSEPELVVTSDSGQRYVRQRVAVRSYSGEHILAHTYVSQPSPAEQRTPPLPLPRYKELVVRRASDAGLALSYVESLLALETRSTPAALAFEPTLPDSQLITLSELAESSHYVGIGGWVFDLRTAPTCPALRQAFGGKDITLHLLQRHSPSCRTTFDDLRRGELEPEQRRWLDALLHELARRHALAGALSYEGEAPRDTLLGASLLGHPSSLRARRPSTLRRRPPGAGLARLVMEEADLEFEAQGHENAGYLSEAHGFMPRLPPRSALPRSHAAWDQAASELPRNYASLALRRTLDALPELAASEADLPEADLLRAAQVLAFLAHAYWYVEPTAPSALPRAISEPWREVSARLGRASPALTYQDLIVANYRQLDPHALDPMSVKNLRLLIPTVDNAAEHTFYLTQVAILAHAAPAIGAMARAQEAAEVDDAEVLETELSTVLACLQRMTFADLSEIDPNPHSARHMEPVTWAKTVAPFAVPLVHGQQGPSGTSSPIFNALDVFLGRKRFETFLGVEIHALRATYPPLWRKYVAALHEVSVRDYVARKSAPELSGLWHDVIDAYSGQGGFLGRHRAKVYGYLELAFKVGRSVTIGGFRGAFTDRTWDQVDGELESARRERFGGYPARPQHARVLTVEPPLPTPDTPVSRVTLDVSGAGLRLRPGDRCGVLPEHSPALIERTLAALEARGDERVALDAEWKAALCLRAGYEVRSEASVEEILRFGSIRPIELRLGEALHALTQDAELERRLRDRSLHALELWELLTLVRRNGFDVRKLYASESGTPSGALPRLVPPERFRMYSVSRISDEPSSGVTTRFELLVAQLRYTTPGVDGRAEPRSGTASSFLARAAGRREPVTIVIDRPAHFRLPDSPRSPLILIAGGTGVAPFRSFLHALEQRAWSAPTLLLLGLRDPSEFTFHDDVAPGLARGTLTLELAFSRAPATLAWDAARGALVEAPGAARRLPDLIRDARVADRLLTLLREERAVLFVCGRQRFAKACLDALEHAFAERLGAEAATALMRQLIADERLVLEVFSGDGPDAAPAAIDVSELSRRRSQAAGYWLAVRERVYDMSEFIERHPGGRHTLAAHAGTDATEAYSKAHHERSEIDAMREMYFIGTLRRLDLGRFSRLVETAHGHQITSLAAVHRAWVRALYLIVEMQNALSKDHALQAEVTTGGDPVTPRSAYKLARAVETHQRFVQGYLDVLYSQTLPPLVELTDGVLGTTSEGAPRPAHTSAPSHARQGVKESLEAAVTALARDGGPPAAELSLQLHTATEALERLDASFLDELAARIRAGVRVFERHEAHTPQLGASELLGICAEFPLLLARYERAVLEQVGYHGFAGEPPAMPSTSMPPESVKTKLLASAHWLMEEDRRNKLVYLLRLAMPFSSVEEITSANQQVVARIRPEHKDWGIVVDMRQAPPRNDPAFEGAMRGLRDAVEVRFARTAVLLESAVGLLQVTRLTREDGAETFATQSEAAALRFARGQPV